MRFMSMLLANMKMTIRNRQVLFWLLVFPVFMMGLFGIIFSNDQGEAKITIVAIAGDILPLLVTVIIGSMCFITVGFAVASFARTVEVADTVGNLIGMPMMFLGGVFFPVDNVPAWIKPVIKVLPLKYLADSLRGVMLHDQSILDISSNLYALLGVTMILFLISVKFFRWESDRR